MNARPLTGAALIGVDPSLPAAVPRYTLYPITPADGLATQLTVISGVILIVTVWDALCCA